jgi:type I restriction enzyme S subunit
MQDNWQCVTLEYLADVIDPQPDHRAPRFVEGGFSYVGIGDIDADGHIRHDQCRKVSKTAVEKQERAFTIEYEDIAFGKVGTVGKVVYLKEQGRYAVSATLVIIKPKEIVDRHFLFHLLQSHQTIENIILRQTGTTRATLGIQQIRAFEYVIPSLPEQKFIAEILDAIDETIAHTTSIIAKLKQIKAGLLHDLLTRGLDENGELRDAIAHPEKFQIVNLASICHRITDGSHQSVKTSDIGVPFLYVSCIRDGQILWEQAAKISEQTYTQISKGREPISGVILYTAVGSYGYAALVKEDCQFSFQRHIAYILPDADKVFPEYLAWWLNSAECRSYADIVALGNAQKTITLGELSKFPVPLPKYEEQKRIATVLEAHDNRIRIEEAYLDKLQLQKKGLMHDLLTGRVRVSNFQKISA